MAKKSTKKQKASQTGEQPVAAATKSKPAKPAKAQKPAKPLKSAQTSTASSPLSAEPASNCSAPEKRVKSSRKKDNAPVAVAARDTAASTLLHVAVLEKPQSAQHHVTSAAAAEDTHSGSRSESTHSDEANALYVLGIRYSTGRDVEQDLIAAHKWFNLATMMGHEGAKSCRADVSSEMSRLQIAEAQRQARDWMRARDTRPSREIEQAAVPEPVARPTYVRRRAQAIRSANSFARLCACV